jgi:hypothetical protein
MKIKAISFERYRATAAQRRLYGGKTVTVFLVFHPDAPDDYARAEKFDGYGLTPGERRTYAIAAARRKWHLPEE